jgi:nicotinate-nucleotide pyrophosphorylase (carboxylating)
MGSAAFRPPHPFLLDPIVGRALEEDLGRAGDITTTLVVPKGARAKAFLTARDAGTVAGIVAAEAAFRLIDPKLYFHAANHDGETVGRKCRLAMVEGSARSILAAERVALNFLGHLSGIATATNALVKVIEGTNAHIVCTRKTTPGMRVLEKYAVRCGGGYNHRFGLDDAVLIKDNHIAAAGGISAAMQRARDGLGHMAKIEIEVDTLEQLKEALETGPDTIMLDNMNVEDLKRAVDMTAGRVALEASGNVTIGTVRAIAETGVEFISSGWITHSAPCLDVGLDFVSE